MRSATSELYLRLEERGQRLEVQKGHRSYPRRPVPNIAGLLKEEITRLARKEIRNQISGMRSASAQQRRDVAALKRQVADLQRTVALLEKQVLSEVPPATPTDGRKTMRFTAKGLRSQRNRLGLTAAEYGKLVGGGLFKQGEWMVRLDGADYELVLRQRSADLAKAQSSLEREEGEAATAAEEFALLPGGSEIPEAQRRLALRQPQLESARAAVSSAEAAVDKAKLDLERTEIYAPFDCIVLNKQIELGAHAQPGAPVADVAGIEAFHVRVRLPPGDLRWVPLPQFKDRTNAVVRVYDDTAWGHFAFREGRVIRGIPERDDRSRMLGLLVEVPEPLPIERDPRAYPPLVLNSFVRVEILGRTLRNAVALPRLSVRDGSVVWVMAEGDRLEIRPVEIAYRGRDDFILRSGVEAGERIVVSDLTAPVAGMLLRAVEN